MKLIAVAFLVASVLTAGEPLPVPVPVPRPLPPAPQSTEPLPVPIPLPAPQPPEEKIDGMPLASYKRLRATLEAAMTAVPGAAAAFAQDARASEEDVLKGLSSTQAIQRELSAYCLAFACEKKKAVAFLVKMLDDENHDVRQAACAALGARGDAETVEHLIKKLESDEAVFVRSEAAAALAEIKDDRAVPALAKALVEDKKPHVRAFCAMALGRFIKTSAPAMAALAAAVENENDPLVRNTIATILMNALGTKLPKEDDGQGDAIQKLKELSSRMREMEAKLRDDRHDDAVLADGGGIEKDLSTLITQLEKSQQQQQQKQEKQNQSERQKQKQERQQAMSQQPKPNSGLGSPVPPGLPQPETAKVEGKQSPWAKLPPSAREELSQAYAEEMPIRWRKRLEAYFISIAGEEVKK